MFSFAAKQIRALLAGLLSLFSLGFALAAPAEPAPATSLARRLADPTQSLTQYKLDLWQTEQGLPLNTVQALLQTRDGYLWVGTAGGLARFDGARFTGFTSEQAPHLASEPVFGLLEDSHQQLWIGHSQGVSLYRSGKFESAVPAALTEGRRVWGFAEGRDGAIWMASENGLLRWHEGQSKRYQQADGLPTNKLRALAFDQAGVLWIATSGGGLVSFAEGKFQVMQPENGLFPHLQVRAVVPDPQGGVWVATAGAGLVHLEHGKVSRTYTMADGLPTDHLTALARDAQGSLWIGTWGAGITRMSADGRFSSVGAAEGLAGSQVWSLALDREGSVWVGTWVGGLNRLRNRAFVVFGASEGLSHDNVRAVLHGRDGVSWVSTAGGGLNRIEGDQITVLAKKDGLPTDEISALAEDKDGSLWIGTYTAGVVRLKDGRFENFGLGQGLPNAEIRSILQDRRGRLWVGTRAGMARFNGERFEPVTDKGVPQEGVLTMLEDRSGTLWFGTSGQGLLRLRDGRFTLLTKADGLLSNWIMALHEDASGSLWIATNGEGMNRLREGRLASIRTSDGLWDGLAQTILEDRQGNLWMSCNRGFYRVARAEMDAVADGLQSKVVSVGYGPGDALRGTTFAGGLQGAGAVSADGRLWLPSANGLVIVDPQRLPGAGKPPGVRVESVLVNGAKQATDAEVLVPPGAVPLAIRFTATTLLYADRARFRYLMEGLSQNWVEVGSLREAAFPALPHGDYRFRVAATIDGVHWSEAEPALDVRVQPRMHQKLWFIVAVLLACGMSVWALFRLRTRSLLARQEAMEQLVALRTEELRQANEHLSRLSYVDALTGLANRRRFDEALHEEWRRSRRTHAPLALLIADIDSFKAYNDVLGHPEGDRCLKAVAGVFADALGRAGDLAARYGGEEFVILIPGADHAAAAAVAESMRAACEALAIPHPASPVGPVVTLSLGVASCLPSDGVTVESLLAAADAALYRAKQDGRNRVR